MTGPGPAQPPVEARKDRIYLTGFMGSGKSTIGPILANTIGYAFVDIDRAVEAREQASVNAIFRQHGEAHFRAAERAALLDMAARPGLVIALGGGTLTSPDSLQIVLQTGILIYLKIGRDQLFRRLRHRNDRPLLAAPDGTPLDDEQLRQRISALYEAREPLYALADITVPTDETRLGLTVDHLVHRLLPLLR